MFMATGIVYIVKNPAFPHLIKIGKTSKTCVEDRGLNASNVAEDFIVLKSYECNNMEEVEAHLHDLFKTYRHFTKTGRKTEFFYVTCENDALRTLDMLVKAGRDTTSELQEIIDDRQSEESEYDETKVRERQRNVFEKLELPIGAELVFIDDETKKCRVVEPLANNGSKRIEYNGKIYSLSGLAMDLREEREGKRMSSRGINWFKYEGELLLDRLTRMEAENTDCDCVTKQAA
jgi:hypothetical protein